jgi:hypothetical protein
MSFSARRKGECGQATLELALGLPLLALLLAGLVEVGLLVSDQTRIWHAAREGARVAIVDPDAADAVAAAERSGLKPLEVEISPAPQFRRQGDALTLKVAYAPRARVPLFGILLRRLELKAQATMRIEHP